MPPAADVACCRGIFMEEHRHSGLRFDSRAIGAAALALGIVGATAIASGSWRGVRGKPPQRHLKVTGSAKKRIVSDLIEWSGTIEGQGADRTSAYKQVRLGTEKTIAFLKQQGIPSEEIFPQSATVKEVTETQYVGVGAARIERTVSKGFVSTQVVEVHSKDVARVEKASREVTALLESGVSITSESPSYYYTGLGALKIEMLFLAGRDARARAENILKSTGGASLGKLISADMGIININPANSTETSEEGNNDVSSLEKDIITIVHADYELE
jgi:uncharacterized protein